MTSEELKAWRIRLGLTQTHAAQCLGLTLSGYWRQEKGPDEKGGANVGLQTERLTWFVENYVKQFGMMPPYAAMAAVSDR